MSTARSLRTTGGRLGWLSAAVLGSSVLALALASGPLHADALMYRGNSGLTGTYADRISPPLALSWKYTSTYAGFNPSSPAVAGETVYFASGSRVYAVDAQTGALKWRYPQDEPLPTAVRTSPAVDGGLVMFGAGDGKLYALNADTGKYVWAFDARSNIGVSPVVVDGLVYFGSGDGRLWAVDAKNGSPATGWARGVKLTDEATGSPAVANGMVYALTADQQLHAIGSATGKARYVVRVGGSVLRRSPVAAGDNVYVAASSNLYCFMGRNLMQRWMVPMPADAATSPTVTDDTIYIVGTDNKVRAYQARTGRPKWAENRLPKLDLDVIAPPAVAGTVMYLGTAGGAVAALDTETGTVKWEYRIEPSTRDTGASTASGSNNETGVPAVTNVAAAPVVANGSLFVLADDGTLCCFRPDAIDSEAPLVTETVPESGIVINGAPPIHFEAKLYDVGSGLDPSTVKVMLDDEAVVRRPEGPGNVDKPGFVYDEPKGTLEYDTPAPTGAGTVRPLGDGRHKFTVVASDWKGNTVTKSWSFTVDNTVARTGRRKPPTTGTGGGPGMGPGGPGGGPGRPGSGGMGPGMPGSGGPGSGGPGYPGSGGGRGRGRGRG